MTQDIWINLPVKNLAKSAAFFTEIGFAPNPGPGNSAQSASFTIGDKKIVLMLFVQEAFTSFINHALSDTTKGTEVLFSLGANSQSQVDGLAKSAKSAGGTVFAEPNESNGFMYGVIVCAREMCKLAFWLRAEKDPDFMVFRAIASESDSLPAGPERQHWSVMALVQEDKKIIALESGWQADALAAAASLREKYENTSDDNA